MREPMAGLPAAPRLDVPQCQQPHAVKSRGHARSEILQACRHGLTGEVQCFELGKDGSGGGPWQLALQLQG